MFTCVFVLVGLFVCVTFLAFLRLFLSSRDREKEREWSMKTLSLIETKMQSRQASARSIAAVDNSHINPR